MTISPEVLDALADIAWDTREPLSQLIEQGAELLIRKTKRAMGGSIPKRPEGSRLTPGRPRKERR